MRQNVLQPGKESAGERTRTVAQYVHQRVLDHLVQFSSIELVYTSCLFALVDAFRTRIEVDASIAAQANYDRAPGWTAEHNQQLDLSRRSLPTTHLVGQICEQTIA
ncbi:MAG TPA: hypothetical protein VGG98_03370 [Solirubrobacteraceae bacterium]|jgi:hypothetical protein